VDAIMKLVGSDITNVILRTPNGSNHKSVNDLKLFVVMQAAINRVDRPSTNNVLEQLLEVINRTFGFCKKISVNMKLLQSNAERMATYGIVIGIPQLLLMLLANIKTATKANYAHPGKNILQFYWSKKKNTINYWFCSWSCNKYKYIAIYCCFSIIAIIAIIAIVDIYYLL
jgi:hypothetical protein